MTGIRILAQRSSFIAIKETNGPRLNLLSFHNCWNSSEWFFFIMIARNIGEIRARIKIKEIRLPWMPGKCLQMNGVTICSHKKISTRQTAV